MAGDRPLKLRRLVRVLLVTLLLASAPAGLAWSDSGCAQGQACVVLRYFSGSGQQQYVLNASDFASVSDLDSVNIPSGTQSLTTSAPTVSLYSLVQHAAAALKLPSATVSYALLHLNGSGYSSLTGQPAAPTSRTDNTVPALWVVGFNDTISYARPSSTSDPANPSFVSSNAKSPLVIDVHATGTFVRPTIVASAKPTLGKPVMFTAALPSGHGTWTYAWSCAYANTSDTSNLTTATPACTWRDRSVVPSVSLTATSSDGSTAYGALAFTLASAATPSPSPTKPSASASPHPGRPTATADSGKTDSNGNSDTPSSGHHSATHQGDSQHRSTAGTSRTGQQPTTSTPTPTPSATPRPRQSSQPATVTGYVISAAGQASTSTPADARPVRATSGPRFGVPTWAWSVLAGVAVLGAGMLGEGWWRVAARRSGRMEP